MTVIEIDFRRHDYHPPQTFTDKLKAMDAVEDATTAVMKLCQTDNALLSKCQFGRGDHTNNTAGEIAMMIHYLHIKQAELERICD